MNFKPLTELELASFNTADISNYFIKRIACDGKSARDFKSINTKAFPSFKDRHDAQDISGYIEDKMTLYHVDVYQKRDL